MIGENRDEETAEIAAFSDHRSLCFIYHSYQRQRYGDCPLKDMNVEPYLLSFIDSRHCRSAISPSALSALQEQVMPTAEQSQLLGGYTVRSISRMAAPGAIRADIKGVPHYLKFSADRGDP